MSLQPNEHAATVGGAWLYTAPYVRIDAHYFSDTDAHDSVLGFRSAK